jgi:hypothetical protein
MLVLIATRQQDYEGYSGSYVQLPGFQMPRVSSFALWSTPMTEARRPLGDLMDFAASRKTKLQRCTSYSLFLE